jgi:hypothetical protein
MRAFHTPTVYDFPGKQNPEKDTGYSEGFLGLICNFQMVHSSNN